ncbi:alpha/beta fold hydrolase [Tundrisphaera lichenicola]|uniref:alpha/beta fold hydrolase n=1 Tax=Tundrisphaera lichenicola TaxID=2029860 RepID=UPI003EB998FF
MSASIDFRAEVAEYDRQAVVGILDGSRHRMTYRTLGQGRPLILVPGLASTYHAYAPTLNRLSRRFQTVQFDYPGDQPDDQAQLGRITHDDLVDDLFALADHLEMRRPSLFGLSFGSTIVLKALHRQGRRFSRAALQGGFARRPLGLMERVALALGRRIPGTTSTLPFHSFSLARKTRSTFPDDRPELWDVYIEQNGLTPIVGLVHRLDLLRELDLRPMLGEISTRILLIHGSADRIVPTSHFDELRKGLRHSTGIMMPGVGHQPHYTHPEELAEMVGDFLAFGRANKT